MTKQAFTPSRPKTPELIVGPWSTEEVEFLRARYPLVLHGKTTAREIAHFLNRSRNAVIARANRLGLAERMRGWHAWSEVEIAYLREHYPKIRTGEATVRGLSAALGRPRLAVLSQARRLKLTFRPPGRPPQRSVHL